MPTRNIRQIAAEPHWSELRLRDRIAPGVRVLFVGINPGVRSAVTGHHFAGYSNRFWKLLYEAGLVPRPVTSIDDVLMPKWGYGVTNLIARPSPGIDDLRPAEYTAGWLALERKIRRYRPRIVAFVGVTLYRALLPFLEPDPGARPARPSQPLQSVVGPRPLSVHDARVFVLPNPSGRNANFSYAEMLSAFRRLKRYAALRPEP